MGILSLIQSMKMKYLNLSLFDLRKGDRKVIINFLIAFLICFSAVGFGQDLLVTRLTDDVMVIEDPVLVNHITVVNTDEGLMVIDSLNTPALGCSARKLIEKMYPGQTVKYVIITHFHGDHIYGLQAFPEGKKIAHIKSMEMAENRFGGMMEFLSTADADIVALKDKLQKLEAASQEAADIRNEIESISRRKEIYKDFKPTGIDIGVDGGATVKLGGKEIRLLYFGPCHTCGDLLVFLPDDRVLVTGDLIFNHFVPSIMVADWGGDVPNTIATLDKLAEMKDQVVYVVPGHGKIGTIQAVKDQRMFLNDLWNAISDARKQGKTLEQVKYKIESLIKNKYKYPVVAQEASLIRTIEGCWQMQEKNQEQE
jgi:cyclase